MPNQALCGDSADPPGVSAGARTASDGDRRMAVTMSTKMPIARRTSPMLKTLANGSHRGSANRSISGARAGAATTALFE